MRVSTGSPSKSKLDDSVSKQKVVEIKKYFWEHERGVNSSRNDEFSFYSDDELRQMLECGEVPENIFGNGLVETEHTQTASTSTISRSSKSISDGSCGGIFSPDSDEEEEVRLEKSTPTRSQIFEFSSPGKSWRVKKKERDDRKKRKTPLSKSGAYLKREKSGRVYEEKMKVSPLNKARKKIKKVFSVFAKNKLKRRRKQKKKKKKKKKKKESLVLGKESFLN